MVTATKPVTAGGIAVAPAGTTLPTNATTALASDYVRLGYVSEDGVVRSTSIDSTEFKDWSGKTVYVATTSRDDEFTFTLIDSDKPEVMKLAVGDANVTGSLAEGIVAKVDSSELEDHVFVIDMILAEGVAKRIVIPNGKVTAIGDISYTSKDAVGYELTVKAQVDDAGYSVYEYTQASA